MPYLTYRALPTLRARRVADGIGLNVLARRAGVTAGHLSRLERGRAGCAPGYARRIAAALDAPVADLFTERAVYLHNEAQP